MSKAVMILAVMLAFCGRLGAQTYDYLTFQTSDGALHSIKTSGLVITFSDGQMKATAGSENLSLSLTELTKMYFSDTNGVDMAEMTGSKEPVVVYGADGRQLGSYQDMDAARASLKRGAYVLKTGGKTVKIAVR